MVGRVAGALSMMSTITTVALLCAEVKVIVAVDGFLLPRWSDSQ